MGRLILSTVVGLFLTLTVWAQTGNTAPQSSASAMSAPAQTESASRHPRNRHRHHTRHPHHHTGISARR
jgi:hypothetical protein